MRANQVVTDCWLAGQPTQQHTQRRAACLQATPRDGNSRHLACTYWARPVPRLAGVVVSRSRHRSVPGTRALISELPAPARGLVITGFGSCCFHLVFAGPRANADIRVTPMFMSYLTGSHTRTYRHRHTHTQQTHMNTFFFLILLARFVISVFAPTRSQNSQMNWQSR